MSAVKLTRVFHSGNSQAVRLPKEFRIASDVVEIFRRGDEIVLREKSPSLAEVLEKSPPWPQDFELPEDPAPDPEDYPRL